MLTANNKKFIALFLLYFCVSAASFFGELSSSEEEDEKDVNIMDSGEEETSRGAYVSQMGDNSVDRATSESQDVIADSDTGICILTGINLNFVSQLNKIK